MSAATLNALIARCRALGSQRPREADAELLLRFVQQRDAAFAELVERYAPLVWGVCRRIVPREADCEDAFQATFLALVRKAGSLDWRRPLGGWLHTVAVRVAHRARSRSRQQRSGTALPERATAGDVVEDVSSRELLRTVDEEIERLPHALRLPMVLCCLHGRTRDEAAEALGCSVAAVKSRLERGRGLLRRRLERRGIGLPAAFLVLGLTGERIRASLWAKTIPLAMNSPPPAVAALARAALRTMAAGKLKLLGMELAIVLMAAGTAGVIGRALTAKPPTSAALPPQAKTASEPRRTEAPRARTDRHGDPLPPGAIARLGTVRWRHGFFIFALTFSPDGKKIAAIGGGRDITLWDAKSGKEIHSFPNEGKQPIGVAFSPDGKLLATADRGDGISIWDADTGKLVRQVKCPRRGLSGLVFSPDGKTLAVGDSGTIYFWDPNTGAEQRRIESKQGYLYTLAFSLDGKLLASGGSRGTGDNDGSILLWDPHTGKEKRQLEIHAKEVNKVVFSPDGKFLASSGWEDAIRLWDPATGRQVRVLTERLPLSGPIAFSPDSTLLAEGHLDGTIRLWDASNGTEKRRWQTGSQRVFTLAFSPDGKTIASAAFLESEVRLWDVATGREKHPTQEHRGLVSFLRFSPDNKELISISSDRQLLRWNLSTKAPRRQFLWNSEAFDPLALSPDGNILAESARYPPKSGVRLWDVRTSKLVRELGDHQQNVWSLAFSPDGQLLASGHREEKVIHIWNVNNGKEIRQIKGFAPEVEWLCFSPDSKALACGMIRRGKPTNEPTLRLWDVASGKERCSFDCHDFTERPLAFSPDGKILASGHGSPGDPPRQESMVRLWDTTTGKELLRHTGAGNTIGSIAFSPDGKLIASGCTRNGDTENSIHVWEAATGRLIRHFEGQHSGIDSLAFSPDGLTLASGAGDSTILLWDITGRRSNGCWPDKLLSSGELDACWKDLAHQDAAKAYDAVWRLAAAPEQAVPFLRKKLPPVPRPDAKAVARLLADLDSSDFTVRRKSTQELGDLGDAIASDLRRALEGKPELEVRRRVQQLLDQARGWNAERLREHRAIQALEHLGTPKAKEVLQALADGAPDARRTEEARAALRRLNRP
jgi:RNA polymerase sigma factor (sigma-70 family)